MRMLDNKCLKVVVAVLLAISTTNAGVNKEIRQQPAIWAVLVAGSNGYENYRHQADVCHAYQVLSQHGIPAENIITMMYDDIANDPRNPTPGQLINEPNGPDVYTGVIKDYTGDDVTPQNFLNVISGNANAMSGVGSGKVLRSGAGDNVFIYFADHGAPGILAFPNENYLFAQDLQNTLKSMNQNQLYGKLVFYLEACESGSMFDGLLPNDINIFATTAANSTEPSYSAYYDLDRGTFLGDLYSVNWLHDADTKDLTSETLSDQFSLVQSETKSSHVQEYGDMTMGSIALSEFLGRAQKTSRTERQRVDPNVGAISSREVAITLLRRKLKSSTCEIEKGKIQNKINDIEKKRLLVKKTMAEIVKQSTYRNKVLAQKIQSQKEKLTDHACYKELVLAFSEKCFNVAQNPYVHGHMQLLVNLCHDETTKQNAVEAVNSVCKTPGLHTGIF